MLVLDEMDQLDSKGQDVLYTLFEWPWLSNSRLVLIGQCSVAYFVNGFRSIQLIPCVKHVSAHRCVEARS